MHNEACHVCKNSCEQKQVLHFCMQKLRSCHACIASSVWRQASCNLFWAGHTGCTTPDFSAAPMLWFLQRCSSPLLSSRPQPENREFVEEHLMAIWLCSPCYISIGKQTSKLMLQGHLAATDLTFEFQCFSLPLNYRQFSWSMIISQLFFMIHTLAMMNPRTWRRCFECPILIMSWKRKDWRRVKQVLKGLARKLGTVEPWFSWALKNYAVLRETFI